MRERREMGCASKVSFIAAVSVGVVEALKDQAGLCRWNYILRSLHQHAKSNVGSLSQAGRIMRRGGEGVDDKAKRSEESLRMVMYLSCWGPN